MLIGFSTGCLYKTHDRLSPETFAIFRDVGCNAIELMCHSDRDVPALLRLKQNDLEGFEYISIHAPSFGNASQKKMTNVLDIFNNFSNKFSLKAVVVHPDEIDEWSVFQKYDLPIAIENMDNRKASCKDVADLKKVFDQIDAQMVLDVNHCYCNDKSMQLARDFMDAFGQRIQHIHVSGFETFHDPLYKTQQWIILDAVPVGDFPIIIESGLEGTEEVKKEYTYIKDSLESKNTSRSIRN